MIKLEYDVKTAGVRVSFVIRDSEMSVDASPSWWENSKKMGDTWVAPQTPANLALVAKLLEAVQSEEAAKGTGPFKVCHWDTFDNETLEIGRFDKLEGAVAFVSDRYKGRFRSTGADQVDIVDCRGNVIRSFKVG